MTYKDRDRRLAFWLSFIYVCASPLMVLYGFDSSIVQSSAMALTGLGVANYFSKPSGV